MERVLEFGRAETMLTAAGTADRTERAPGLDLAATIRAVASGDHAAFARLHAEYVRMVHAIVLSRVPRRDVDDVVQDVFVTAYLRIRELRDAASLGGWLAAIARNRATDYLRHARQPLELPPELPGGDPIESEALAVLDIIRKLPDAYRETLLMRLVEGMTGGEIAARTGLTTGSVRVNLHRGMKLLRAKLGCDEARPCQE